MKKLLCLLGGAMLAIQVQAQQIRPLSVGDTVPDLLFENVMNSPETSFKLSDFKGKLIILDFFGTWCGACVGSIPKMDSLQKVMGDKLKVIVICEDRSNKDVSDFIRKKWNSQAKVIALPFVLYDSTTISLFPHRMVPHEVWISPEGKLLATTGSREVTLAHLKDAAENPDIKLEQKVDLMHFDRTKPLFVDGNGGSIKPLLIKSVLSKKIDGVGSSAGTVIDSITHKKRMYFINATPVTLFQRIYKYPRNRVMFNFGDSVKFVKKIKKGFFNDLLYCYELTTTDTTSKEMVDRIMFDDIVSNLDMKASVEKKWLDCFVLKKIDEGNLPTPKHITKQFGSINILVSKLEYEGFFPIVDETNYRGDINFGIPEDSVGNPQKLKEVLKRKGLALESSRRRIDVLVLSKK